METAMYIHMERILYTYDHVCTCTHIQDQRRTTIVILITTIIIISVIIDIVVIIIMMNEYR